jgi:hypothetical protein
MTPSGVDEVDQIVDATIVDGTVVDEVVSTELDVPQRLTSQTLGRLKTRKASDRTQRWLNALLYGESGAGKTLLAAQAALVEELSPVLFIDMEAGTRTLDHLPPEALELIDIYQPEKWDDLQAVYNELFRGRHPYKTVVVDSITEAQALNMAKLAGYSTKVELDASLPKFEEWNETTAEMRRFFRAFRDLRMNTIFTATVYEDADPSKGTKDHPAWLVRPNVSKKLRSDSPAFFDFVAYLYVQRRGGGNVRFALMDRDDRITAKCRTPGVGIKIENPTMKYMYDVMVRNPGQSTVDFDNSTVVTSSTGTSSQAQQPMMKKKK